MGVCLAIAVVGFLGGSALYLSGRPRLETPDLDRWQGGDEPAWSSPPWAMPSVTPPVTRIPPCRNVPSAPQQENGRGPRMGAEARCRWRAIRLLDG